MLREPLSFRDSLHLPLAPTSLPTVITRSTVVARLLGCQLWKSCAYDFAMASRLLTGVSRSITSRNAATKVHPLFNRRPISGICASVSFANWTISSGFWIKFLALTSAWNQFPRTALIRPRAFSRVAGPVDRSLTPAAASLLAGFLSAPDHFPQDVKMALRTGTKVGGARSRPRRRQNWRNKIPHRVGQVGVVESRAHLRSLLPGSALFQDRRQLLKHPLRIVKLCNQDRASLLPRPARISFSEQIRENLITDSKFSCDLKGD